MYVPSSVRARLINWMHTTKFSAHPRTSRTIALISRRFWWPSLHKDVKEFVLACPVCARNKSSHLPLSGLLQPLPIPKRPWSHIAIDFVTGLPVSNGMTTIFTVVDRFSKACHLIPLRKLPTSFQTAQLLVKHIFKLHGIPQEILSDRGPQFTAHVWKHFCAPLEAKVCLSSGYHPQSNEQTEHMNQELESTLRCLTSTNPTDWSQFLHWVEYAHNSHVSSATGLSSFEVSLGYQPPLFPADEKEITVTSVQHHIRRCCSIWRNTVTALNRSSEQNRRFADRRRRPAPDYTPGQLVWLSTRNIPLKSMTIKVISLFHWPLQDRVYHQSYCCPVTSAFFPPNPPHVPRLADQACPDQLAVASVRAPAAPPQEIDGHPAFTVRRIVDSR
uniref:Gypsy retrotransposon integrase-like protein 1 n=1 Tax=Poecilia reticulata TaxID=8081 RepID=A0A3P9PCK2_POERE